jgi:uncharacterized protein YbgA (DUF1722 family)/uncharacterized protein YbbK (DUF523 family)
LVKSAAAILRRVGDDASAAGKEGDIHAARHLSAEKIRVGVSACLLGAKVRYDGEHKRNPFLVDELAPYVEWVPICPELDVGMGVPRESVRLVRGRGALVRMLGNRSGEDWTQRMNDYAEERVRALEGLSAYVLKSKSPSCGMERVKLYASDAPGAPAPREGVGLFAAALRRRWPNLPVEEEGRLEDARLRESFIERLFAYHRLQQLWQRAWTVGDLVAFHTGHKMVLLAHDEEGYRALGRLVARAKRLPRARLQADYERGFMSALAALASRSRHTNVLMHMLGHLRGPVDERDRAELLALIKDYRRGLVPLIVPVTLLRHHVSRTQIAYLAGQIYLEPHPKELMLRNHV